MKTLKKLTAIILSVLMLFTMVATSVSASYDAYLGSDITNQYNSIDKVVLEKEQQASLILDKLDVLLAKAEISIDLPIIGTIDLTSVDNALDSIYNVTGNWLYGNLTVGDLAILKTHRNEIASLRRTTAGISDFDLILSVISYLAECAPTLVGMIDPNANFSWGIVKGFLPPEIRLITDDFNEWLDNLIWNLIHPVNAEAKPQNLTLDSIVQFLCDNQIGAEEGSQRATAMGFSGVMPGFSVNIETDSGYRIIEEGIYHALNTFIVPLLNSLLKGVIQNAVASNQAEGGDLYQIVDVNYVIEKYTFDRTKSLMQQINEVIGYVVNLMLKPLDERPEGTPYTFVWQFNIPNGETYLDLLKENIRGILSMIIVAGGEETFDPYGNDISLKQIGDYISRVAVEEFVKHMDVPENATMEEVAYLGLRELCASVVPENYSAKIVNGTAEQYRDAVIELAADLGAYFLNNNIGLNSALNRTADQFLWDFADWCMTYIEGLFDNADYRQATTGWERIDAVLWSVIPQNWLPVDALSVEDEFNFQIFVDRVLDIIFDFDVDKLYELFTHVPTSPLSGSARTAIISFVSNILNKAFTPAGETSCVPTGITTFDSLVNPISNAADIICNILETLEEDSELQSTVLNLIVMIMGLAEPQSLGDVDLDIDSRINCISGTANSRLRISNFSSGVNSAWRNTNGIIEQDQMYKIKLVSLTNTAGLTMSVANGTIGGTEIPANGFLDVMITGAVAQTTEARFDLSYYILDESGAIINNGTPLVKSVYTHLYKESGNYDIQSAEVAANNVTFAEFPTYLYTTNVYNSALFSILATNRSGNESNITKAIVSGNLPTGIEANAPQGGVIVSIDNASITSSGYGTVNPYVSNVNPDAEQPYGIYNVNIQFEVKGRNIFGTTTGTTAQREHKIVVYNNFGLDRLLDEVMTANRQRVDYSANATDEWNAYLAAVSAGYNLLDGNPNHAKMFDDVNSSLDGVQNDYYIKAEAIKNAVEALDEKAITDSLKLADLQTAVSAYGDINKNDYVLFTYDRFRDAYNNAKAIVDSQTAPVGEESSFEAPAVKVSDLVYAKNQLNLWGGRLINKAVTTDYLEEELAASPSLRDEMLYAPELWVDAEREIILADRYLRGTIPATQGKINASRINLMEAVHALKPNCIEPLEDGKVDYINMILYNIEPECTDIYEYFLEAEGYDELECIPSDSDYVGTGSIVKVYEDSEFRKLVAVFNVVLYGDVNGDGLIDAADKAEMNAFIAGTDSVIKLGNVNYKAADINFDGVVDSRDIAVFESGNISQNPAA